MNALAATAMALALGMRPGSRSARAWPCHAGARAAEPDRTATAAGRLMDDSYNANPASLYAALQVLSSAARRALAVLGDMLELGEDERKLHAETGRSGRGAGR